MQASGYASKVPPSVQAENTAKAAKLSAELERIAEAMENFLKLREVDGGKGGEKELSGGGRGGGSGMEVEEEEGHR